MARAALPVGVTRVGAPCGLLLVLLTTSGCSFFGPSTVDRRFHGKTVEGPFVSPEAYAAMTRGSVHEAKGELEAAKRDYGSATRDAPDLAEPWARLGAVLCRLGEDAGPAFRRGASVDPSLATVWMERARCLLLQKRPADAASAANVALRLAPSDVQTSLLLHEMLQAADDRAGATRIFRGMEARWPDDPRVRALASSLEPAVPSARDAVDAALRAGDEPRAERLAKAARLPLAALALRAAACGRLSLAARLAALVFRADPASSDARVALLVTADLQRDETVFREALGSGPLVIDGSPAPRLSPLAEALLADLLQRRAQISLSPSVGDAAADPLAANVWARVRPAPPGKR